MRGLVRWLLTRRLGKVEAERFLEELDELHRVKIRAQGEEAGDRWLRREERRALVSGLGGLVQRTPGTGAEPGRQKGSRTGFGESGRSLVRDLRFGFRTLRKRPLFAILVVGTLGLGIGASTTVFSLVDGVLLRDMDYERPGELVTIWATFPSWRDNPLLQEAWDKIGLNWEEYVTLRDETRAFAGVGGHRSGALTLTGAGDAVRLDAGEATASLFHVLGVRPLLGRTFLPGEDGPGAPRLAVLSHELWQTRFGSDPAILGRPVTLNGQPFEVIGVLPRGVRIHSTLYRLFNSAIDAGERAVWVPANWARQDNDGDQDLEVVGRVGPGVSREQALAEVDALVRGERSQEDIQFRLTPPREESVRFSV